MPDCTLPDAAHASRQRPSVMHGLARLQGWHGRPPGQAAGQGQYAAAAGRRHTGGPGLLHRRAVPGLYFWPRVAWQLSGQRRAACCNNISCMRPSPTCMRCAVRLCTSRIGKGYYDRDYSTPWYQYLQHTCAPCQGPRSSLGWWLVSEQSLAGRLQAMPCLQRSSSGRCGGPSGHNVRHSDGNGMGEGAAGAAAAAVNALL
jgi:hypothetical protein